MPEQGSRFSFTLTLPICEIAPQKQVSTMPQAAGELRQTLERRAMEGTRVLVVEDSLINQKVTLKMLELAGCQAEAAANGKEALAMLVRGRHELILMDIQMPEMDGLEATRRIRGGEIPGIDPRIPIVALTAHALKGDRERFLAAGMDDYLPKPIQTGPLARALERFTGGGQKADREPDRDGVEAAFDQRGFLSRLGGDTALAEEILGLFLEDAKRQIDLLVQSMARGDLPAVRLGAHRLKGAAGNVSALCIQGVAARIERVCQDERPLVWTDSQDQLREALDQFRESISALRMNRH